MRVVLLALIFSCMLGRGAAQKPMQTGVYTYSGAGTVNTRWIETPGGGLVIFDVQRDLTHAREAIAAVEKTGKPVRAIFITHGHPDHYAGIGLFKQAFPAAVVWSSKATFTTIRDDPYGFNALMHKVAAKESPERFALPDKTFDDNQTLEIDGLRVVTREFGRAEANSATVYYIPQSGDLYSGDLILYQLHALFGEAATTQWLAALDRLDLIYPLAKTVHPGHGATGPKEILLADEREYVVKTRRLAMAEYIGLGTAEQREQRAVDAINGRYQYVNPAGVRLIVPISVHGMFIEFAQPGLSPVVH